MLTETKLEFLKVETATALFLCVLQLWSCGMGVTDWSDSLQGH